MEPRSGRRSGRPALMFFNFLRVVKLVKHAKTNVQSAVFDAGRVVGEF